MAFTCAFSPTFLPLHRASSATGPRLEMPSLKEQPPLHLGAATIKPAGAAVNEDRTPCQFAPLLHMRRTQVLEAAAWADQDAMPHCSQVPSPEDELRDALKSLDALNEALRSADAVDFYLTAHESLESHCKHYSGSDSHGKDVQKSDSVEVCQQMRRPSARDALFNKRSFCRSTSRSQSPLGGHFAVVDVAVTVAEAAVTVAGLFLSAATASATMAYASFTCVRGVLILNSDLSVEPELLQEPCQVALSKLLEPIAQVNSITITCVDEDDLYFPFAQTGHRCDCTFEYEVDVTDPHDVEPVRETLFLESESGGARHLLPLLAEQICDDGLPTPRYLKVRLEVQGGS